MAAVHTSPKLCGQDCIQERIGHYPHSVPLFGPCDSIPFRLYGAIKIRPPSQDASGASGGLNRLRGDDSWAQISLRAARGQQSSSISFLLTPRGRCFWHLDVHHMHVHVRVQFACLDQQNCLWQLWCTPPPQGFKVRSAQEEKNLFAFFSLVFGARSYNLALIQIHRTTVPCGTIILFLSSGSSDIWC